MQRKDWKESRAHIFLVIMKVCFPMISMFPAWFFFRYLKDLRHGTFLGESIAMSRIPSTYKFERCLLHVILCQIKGKRSLSALKSPEIFTSCFNFDLNQGASEKKMSIFQPRQKISPSPCKWHWTGAIRRPAIKTDKIFIERKGDILL